MKIATVFYFFVIIAILTGCSPEKQAKDKLACIDVTRNYPEKKIFLTDIAEIEYLYLNSDDDDYLYSGSISKLTKNTVVVYSHVSGDILFFTRDGMPKSRFNRKGYGPEEYTGGAFGFVYDEDTDDLFVSRMNDIIVYSSTGKFKRKFVLPQGVRVDGRMVSFDEHSLFLYNINIDAQRARSMSDEAGLPEKHYPFYHISKTNGEVLNAIEIPYVPLFLGIYVDGQRIPGIVNRLVKCPEGVLLCSAETDTIFLYSHDKSLTPILYKTPSVSALDPMVYLNHYIDGGQYQFIEVCTARKGDEYIGIFPVTHYTRNKRTGEIFRPKFLLPDYKDKEFIITPRGLGYMCEDGYYFELDLIELKQAYRENKLSGKLKELVATLNEDEDNNVFMLLHFK